MSGGVVVSILYYPLQLDRSLLPDGCILDVDRILDVY